jgi:hypothetical protein
LQKIPLRATLTETVATYVLKAHFVRRFMRTKEKNKNISGKQGSDVA